METNNDIGLFFCDFFNVLSSKVEFDHIITFSEKYSKRSNIFILTNDNLLDKTKIKRSLAEFEFKKINLIGCQPGIYNSFFIKYLRNSKINSDKIFNLSLSEFSESKTVNTNKAKLLLAKVLAKVPILKPL